MDELMKNIATWQRKVFPGTTPSSCTVHMQKEMDEIKDHVFLHNPLTGMTTNTPKKREDIETDNLAEECADMVHLLVMLAERAGFSLHMATAKKFQKNLLRDWKPPDEHGVVEHVRGKAD